MIHKPPASSTYLQKVLERNPDSLYLIIDAELCECLQVQPIEIFKIAFAEGIRIFQYRNKKQNEEEVEKDAYDFYFPLIDYDRYENWCIILNDDIRLAKKLYVPLHLGQSDFPKRRTDLKGSPLDSYGYGASSHNLQELTFLRRLRRHGLGPVYTAFGAIFDSPTKPDVKNALHLLPEFFANKPSVYSVMIGGLSVKNLQFLVKHLKKTGQDSNVFYAVISGIFENGTETKQIQKTIRAYRRILQWPVP